MAQVGGLFAPLFIYTECAAEQGFATSGGRIRFSQKGGGAGAGGDARGPEQENREKQTISIHKTQVT